MSRIKTTEDLYQAMRLDGIDSIESLENKFAEIADALLNDFAINRGEETYRFVEIEFYHNITDDDGKKITYKRGLANSCDFFFHPSGVDLCFESNGESYGGILIRSIQSTNGKGTFINGPGRVADTLFDKFSAIHIPSDFPQLIPFSSKDGKHIIPEASRRWIKTSDKKYRYSWPEREWAPNPKEYKASPWI
jgi:hypothetical protein